MGSINSASDTDSLLLFDYNGLSHPDILLSLTQQLCMKIFPSANPDNTIVQHIGTGNYNEVIGITINDHGRSATYRSTDLLRRLNYPPMGISAEAFEKAGGKFVLRIPKLRGSIEKSVAALKYLANHTPFTLPELIHYDITFNNPMTLPYMLMNWVEGTPLSDVLRNNALTQPQRVSLARELALFYRQMQGVASNIAGEIFPGCIVNIDGGGIAVQPIGTHPRRRDPALFIQSANSTSASSNSSSVLVEAYRRKLKEATEDKRSPLRDYVPQLMICLNIAGWLSKAGLLKDENTYCLCHTDLFPRNIMVDPSKTPMITAIIDWDEPIFAPKFSTCLPPVWIWQDLGRQKDEVENFGSCWSAADSPEHEQVKHAFEEVMGPDYVDMAYSPQYVIARRLLKFARDPIWQWKHWYIDSVDELQREWAKLVAQPVPQT